MSEEGAGHFTDIVLCACENPRQVLHFFGGSFIAVFTRLDVRFVEDLLEISPRFHRGSKAKRNTVVELPVAARPLFS